MGQESLGEMHPSSLLDFLRPDDVILFREPIDTPDKAVRAKVRRLGPAAVAVELLQDYRGVTTHGAGAVIDAGPGQLYRDPHTSLIPVD